jgi:P pilus assembly chaperone PapD
MQFKRKIAIGLPVVLCAGIALAGIDVTPTIIIMEGRATQEATITVTNSGDRITYVTTQAREVMARGETDEKLRVDPEPTSLGLISTPARLVLEKGERRGVRVVAINPPGADDRVWRVKVAPVAGRLKSGQSGVAFLIGYDALIIQRAANPVVTVTGTRAGKALTLRNVGNSFGMVSEVKHCPNATAADCVKLPDTKRLYSGKEWTVNLPTETGKVEVSVDGVAGRKSVLTF